LAFLAKSGALAREGGGEDEREEGEDGARGEEQLSEIQQTLGFEFFPTFEDKCVHTKGRNWSDHCFCFNNLSVIF